MRNLTRVYMFGSLQVLARDLYDLPVQVDLKAPTPLADVLRKLKIPADRVQLAMVNNRAVPWDSDIHPGDRLSLFPKEYPVFADWRDLRF